MTAGKAARPYPRGRVIALAAVLAAAVIVWALLPARPGPLARLALICAAAGGLGSVAQLALAGLGWSPGALSSAPERAAGRVIAVIRGTPWAEILTVAVLVLEVAHPSRPWHTALLGVALLAYLLAVHLAETSARPGALAPQVPLLAAGTGLLALAAGVASWPALPPGPAATAVRVAGTLAAIVAGLLAVPAWPGAQRDR